MTADTRLGETDTVHEVNLDDSNQQADSNNQLIMSYWPQNGTPSTCRAQENCGQATKMSMYQKLRDCMNSRKGLAMNQNTKTATYHINHDTKWQADPGIHFEALNLPQNGTFGYC